MDIIDFTMIATKKRSTTPMTPKVKKTKTLLAKQLAAM